MPYRYLVENGLLLYPEKTEKMLIGIEGEVIRLLPPTGTYEAEERIDATGCYILPGLIDPHVHPVYADDLSRTSFSAVFGGVTTLLHYASIKPGADPLDVIARMKAEGEHKSYVDFGLHASLCDAKNQLGAIPALAERGVRSFKMFTAYEKLGWMTDDRSLVQAFDRIAEVAGIACVHAENGRAVDYLEEKHRPITSENFLATSPALLDKEAIFRTLCLAKITGCPLYLPHVSSRKAAEALALGKEEGVNFFSETCPHYLAFSWDALKARGPLGKLRPPIKNEEDREALWRAVEDTVIDTIGSAEVSSNDWRGGR